MNKEVEIIRYVTKKSFDAYVWQILETKQKFISQLFAGSKEIRTMSDIDNTTMNFGEIKAIATDNQEIMEKFEIDMKVQALKLKERNYNNQRYTFEDKLKISLPKQIERESNFIEKCKADLQTRNQETSQEFTIELNNKIFNDPKEAGEEIIKSVNKNIDKDVLNNIFSPFEKGVNGVFGLGLSIVKKTLTFLNYDINIQNTKNGVKFIIS